MARHPSSLQPSCLWRWPSSCGASMQACVLACLCSGQGTMRDQLCRLGGKKCALHCAQDSCHCPAIPSWTSSHSGCRPRLACAALLEAPTACTAPSHGHPQRRKTELVCFDGHRGVHRRDHVPRALLPQHAAGAILLMSPRRASRGHSPRFRANDQHTTPQATPTPATSCCWATTWSRGSSTSASALL